MMDSKDFNQDSVAATKHELRIELTNFTFTFRVALIIALLVNMISEKNLVLTGEWSTLLLQCTVVYTIASFLIEHFSRNEALISITTALSTAFDAVVVYLFVINYADISHVEILLLMAVAVLSVARVESTIVFSLISGTIIMAILWVLTQKSYSAANFVLVIILAVIFIFVIVRFKLMQSALHKKLEITRLTSVDAKQIADMLFKLNTVSQKLNDVMITKELLKIVFNDIPDLLGTHDLGLILYKDNISEADFYSSKNDNILSPIQISFTNETNYLITQTKYHFVMRGENPVFTKELLEHCPQSAFKLFNESNYIFLFKFTYPQNIKGYLFFATPKILDRNMIQVTTLLTKQIGIALSNSNLYQQANELAASDVLTGLKTRRVLKTFVQSEMEYCNCNQKSFVILFTDIDNFKRFNDTFGHHIGDEVLKLLARETSRMVEPTDLVCRFGGEEFVVVLHDCDIEKGKELAERLRHTIESVDLKTEMAVDSKLTISVGGAVYPNDERDSNELVKKADWAMYRAKMAGKNRVYFFSDFKEAYVPAESGKSL